MQIATIHADIDTACTALAQADADVVEVRLDALWPQAPGDEAADHLLALTDAGAGKRLLATLRPKRQGGAFAGDETIRISLLIAAARAGFDVIDLEADTPEAAKVCSVLKDEADLLVSDHGLPTAPSRDEGLRRLQAMQDLPGMIEKLAFPCGSFMDKLRALELVHAHRERHGHPAVAPIGGGAGLRALLAVAGNAATYGHAQGAPPAVSGQPALDDVRRVWDHWGLHGDERADGGWFAVLGDPVHHSLSPRIHNAALRAAGDGRRFAALQVPDSIGAVRLLAGVAGRIGLQGASVTMPLKGHAAQVCQGDEAVQATGAANCIRFQDGRGTNTDALALRDLLRGPDVAVLGAGGAANAALWAAAKNGIDATLVSRAGPRTDATLERFDVRHVDWDDRESVRAHTWVQATPLGMHGEDSPVQDGLEGAEHAIELVYGDGPTRFQACAQAVGAAVIDGKAFLVAQAVHAYRFWLDQTPDRAAMEAAL